MRSPASLLASLAVAFEALYQKRYTGPTTLHWKNGIPRTMQIPESIQEIRLDAPPDPSRSEAAASPRLTT